jgi:tRNA (guanine37-N1)-methyltransferase
MRVKAPSVFEYFQVIGDIALVSIPTELECQKSRVAQSIISRQKNIKTILNKVSKLEGERRVASFEVIAGNGTITTYREFGFVYRLDVAKVFFNSRLSYERMRIASLVRPNEMILVPFCGVGPFAIPLAAQGARVLALEKNPEACKWLVENVMLNGVKDNMILVKGDASFLPQMLKLNFDRVVVPTPYGWDNILDIFYNLMKFDATIHFYTFKQRHEIEDLIRKFEMMGFHVQFYRKCGNVAPSVSRWVFDLVKSAER